MRTLFFCLWLLPPFFSAVGEENGSFRLTLDGRNEAEIVHGHVPSQPGAFLGAGTLSFEAGAAAVTWKGITLPKGGRYLLLLKYANEGETPLAATLSVDDGAGQAVSLPSSVSHTPDKWPSYYGTTWKQNWRFAAVPVALDAGMHALKLSLADGAQDLLLDNLTLLADPCPKPPPPFFDPRDFGARGDGKTLDTAAIQRAIDACRGSGGSVVLRGGRFLSGSLSLGSKMTFWIDAGTVLLASPIRDDWPSGGPPHAAPSIAFLFAEGASDLVLSGGGLIDGEGSSLAWDGLPESGRPSLLLFRRCRNVTVSRLDLANAACWSVVPDASDKVTFEAVNLVSMDHPNRDGIDPCDSHDVTVSDCSIVSDDDALCPKSFTSRGVRGLRVRNVALNSGANAIKFGTDSYGCFDDASFDEVTVTQAREAGISLGIADGAEMKDIAFRNLRIGDVLVPISILQGAGLRGRHPENAPSKPGGKAGSLSRILFDGLAISARKTFPSFIGGVAKDGVVYRVEDVLLRNIEAVNDGGGAGGKAPPEYAGEYPDYGWMKFIALPASGLYLRHTRHIRIENCRFTTRSPDARPPVIRDDALEEARANLHSGRGLALNVECPSK